MTMDLDDLLDEDEVEWIDWEAVVDRLASHPHEAAMKNSHGPRLHWALFIQENDNPITLAVVNAFVDAYKDALLEVDEEENTPLHLACLLGISAEIILALLKANPDAASVTNVVGEIPLHAAHDPEVVDSLLDTYPEGVGIVDQWGRLPLHYVFDEEQSPSVLQSLLKVGNRQNVGGINGGGGVFLEDSEGKTPLTLACEVIEDEVVFNNLLWEKVHILVRATYTALAMRNNHAIVNEDVPLLHAVIEINCPEFVILRTLPDNLHQMNMRDYRGRTPLSIAASQHNISPEIAKALLDPDHFDSRIAGMANKEKRLPLHLAAESGWDFEHLEVIRQAAPAALETRDIPTRMYPFMLAAEGGHSNLNSIYQLLRASPRMACGMAEGIHWEISKLKLEEDYANEKERNVVLEGEISKLKKSNAEHLRKIAEQAEEIEKLREMNKVLERHASDQDAKRRKLSDA